MSGGWVFSGRPVAFIAHDHMMEAVVADIVERLRASDIEIIHGPETMPGVKLAYPPESWHALLGRADVALFSSRSLCTDGMLAAAPRLRAVVGSSIGLETVDVQAATRRGILVGHAATIEGQYALAEATIMLILMQLYQPLKSRDVLLGLRPRPEASASARWASLLARRTVGLVGFGRIAQQVAQRLVPFNVRILVSGRAGLPPKAALPAGVEAVDLDTLLQASDVVSLHVALDTGEKDTIGARELALMKPGAHLVNTSRGEAIDEDALFAALKSGRLAGAALDTFKIEPLPQDSPLRTLDNVFLTPHLVGHTRDSFENLPSVAVENLTRPLRGEPPLYCKNPEAIPAWRARFGAALAS